MVTIETICQHLIDGGLDQPHGLYLTTRRASYCCPACLLDSIERRLKQPGGSPLDAATRCHFTKCQCSEVERVCFSCLAACVDEITNRWVRLLHTDKTKANQLHRVRKHWNRHFDPHGIGQAGAFVESSHPQTSVEESAEDRRIRRYAERIATRRKQILRERGFPAQRVLGATGVQPARVVVIPPHQL